MSGYYERSMQGLAISAVALDANTGQQVEVQMVPLDRALSWAAEADGEVQSLRRRLQRHCNDLQWAVEMVEHLQHGLREAGLAHLLDRAFPQADQDKLYVVQQALK